MNEKKRKKFIAKLIARFESLEDKSDEGLRNALIGSPPDPFGKVSLFETGDLLNVIIHEFNHSFVRYHLRYMFAKYAVIDHKAIDRISKKRKVDQNHAKAIYFADLYVLCKKFEEDGLKFIQDYSTKILKQAYLDIHKSGPIKALKQFRKKASKKKKAENYEGFATVDYLVNNADRFIKTPRVGRRTMGDDKTEIICACASILIELKMKKYEEKDFSDILTGQIDLPKITQIELAESMKISRPTLLTWLKKSGITFRECIDRAQKDYRSGLKSLLKGT